MIDTFHWKRTFILAGITIVYAVSNSQAGTISFYKKDNCSEIIAKADSSTELNENLKKSSFASNDDIRSVKFEDVPGGTVLELWDDSEQRGNDDWCRITIEKTGSYQVNNIEKNPNVPGLLYERHAKDKDDAKKKFGNLAGKVSHVKLISNKLVIAVGDKIERMYAWGAKNGRAHEFVVNDSNYRIWKPTLGYTSGGVTAIFKMDHIRGSAADDHGSVTLEFDSNGILVLESTSVQMAGKNPIIKVLEARNAVAKELAAAVDDPKAKAVALVIAAAGAMQTAILEAIEEAGEKGGRLSFPGAIHQQTVKVGTIIASAIVNR